MPKNKIADHMTYIYSGEDIPYLRSELLPVNIRLFHSSVGYRETVLRCCQHLEDVAMMEFEDYTKPYGISGANVAIPFNIIGLVGMRNLSSKFVKIMINPSIQKISYPEGTKIVETNCGSIRLEKPIKLKRWKKILVNWYDKKGELVGRWFSDSESFTLQHEILHNQGILITDPENENYLGESLIRGFHLYKKWRI